MTLHAIEPDGTTVHGHFSRDLPPILTIESGDTLRFRTLDAGWGFEPPHLDGTKRRLFERIDIGRDNGHALCGPIAIRGARPGMVLEVAIDKVEPDTWGWTRAGGWKNALNERLGVADAPEHLLVWTLDTASGTATDQHGRSVKIRPFVGVIGMPPPERGNHSTFPPRRWGGNIDCKELIPGSRLFLPIPVDDALLSVGDGHAAQGDGEVAGPAIECPMKNVELTVTLRPDLQLEMPMADTPAGEITFGFSETLDDAAMTALDGMVRLLGTRYGIERRDALALASVVVDLRVTQIVNGIVGVHALLTKGALGGVERHA